MDVNLPLRLLGDISPTQFMRRYWHKKPLLVRQAVPGFSPTFDRAALLRMAQDEAVSSRLVSTRQGGDAAADWKMRSGPFSRRSLPPRKQPGWTLLVQGVDSVVDEVRGMRERFRFVPDARLDDVMVSYATDGGGVGPHFDSYDVFLLQAHGQRRWRIGCQQDLTLRDGLALKVLANFQPDEEYLLNPGDMLYLPPRVAHEGVAIGECMTWSIGFRAPGSADFVADLLQRLALDAEDGQRQKLYRDPRQAAVREPAALPAAMVEFARTSLLSLMQQPQAIERVVGEALTEPKATAWFEPSACLPSASRWVLDRNSRMLYDLRHVYINGESFLASGRDATLMRELADTGQLRMDEVKRASRQLHAMLAEWTAAGWVHGR